ncbi:hypothetical protein [Arenibacterium halophilum]|uniref:Uncharacterized protein n=1 Tax=Arenibacterium halophilum TaxID=2583821 RepID=A0ABY2XG93_9RHOB|nr:hypothetical protein [Arenibacterium halophilum]TMV15493.1 hypothetical protein FGK64_05955 [Arenibacterium halophilum]
MTIEPTLVPEPADVARHLQTLADNGTMTAADAESAHGLAYRLTAPARVAILTQGQEDAVFAAAAMAALRSPDLDLACMTLPEDPAGLMAALTRLGATTDIILWCARRFDAPESRAWAQVPDPLKDHSLLVAPPGTPKDALALMQLDAQHDFARFIAVAEGFDFTALSHAVRTLVAAGRGALVDAADVLLLRAALPSPTAGDPVAAPDSPVRRNQHFTDLAEYLAQRGAELLPLATNPRAVLDNCLAACEAVAESLNAGAESDAALADDVTDAADRMLLIAMEDGPAAAADAVAILLQLRRDFECRAAA